MYHTSTTFAKYSMFVLSGPVVVIVSIVRVIVLASLKKSDLTWNLVNGGIWAITEPSVGVMCACLPSLRPLFTVASQVLKVDTFKTLLPSSHGSKLGRGWTLWADKHGNSEDSEMTCIPSWTGSTSSETNKPLGHDVNVHGGADVEVGEDAKAAPPEGEIRVKTEVVLVSSKRLDYQDRIF
ncbi:MAG: hypothetical protein Q9172_000605 [Xanthocarpia lactea]